MGYYGFWQTLKRTLKTLLTTKNPTATVLAYKFDMSYRRAFVNSEHYKQYNQPGLKAKFRLNRPAHQKLATGAQLNRDLFFHKPESVFKTPSKAGFRPSLQSQSDR